MVNEQNWRCIPFTLILDHKLFWEVGRAQLFVVGFQTPAAMRGLCVTLSSTEKSNSVHRLTFIFGANLVQRGAYFWKVFPGIDFKFWCLCGKSSACDLTGREASLLENHLEHFRTISPAAFDTK